MQRSAYNSDAHVRGFLRWAAPFVTGDRRLDHQWTSPKFGSWSCDTLIGAYHCFKWRFSVKMPGESTPTRGVLFEENTRVLSRLSGLLHQSVAAKDSATFLCVALAVVAWGGVQGNVRRLRKLGENSLPTVLAAAEQLDSGHR